MAIRIVRLGSPRHTHEGVRLGTVRRPPRGVAKARFAKDDWYDVWLPTLSPSAGLVAAAQAAADDKSWKAVARKYRAEMAKPDAAHLLDTLAALSRTTNFSVGCYCEDEARCHRSVLRAILRDHGATVVG
jgi:uncharacterized protein YeaO (DUF488 family)